LTRAPKNIPTLIAKDHIQERITELFAGKVGKKLDEKRLATIYREGTERYEQKIPPGYKDSDKGGTRQFGDLVIWNELLEHARATKLPIIFITSDTKEDWWWKQGQQTIGPRPELVQEVPSFASAKFYMYTVERFLSEAQKRFDTKVEATAVKEAAEEFKDIQQKKAEETFPNVSTILRDWQVAALGIKRVSSQPEGRLPMQWLETIPASEAGKVVNTVWVHAVEDLLGRSCTKKEADMIRRVVRSEPFFRIASTAKNLWEIAEKLALLFDYEGKIEKLKMP
jgi:PIN like domain